VGLAAWVNRECRAKICGPLPLSAEPAQPRVNPWIIAAVVSLAAFMEVLDTSIANVALPYMAGGLAASVDDASWVLTSYLVANAIVFPISGWLSARGPRRPQEEWERLFAQHAAAMPIFIEYQRKTSGQIPAFVFERID
jgi:hypothetical protein